MKKLFFLIGVAGSLSSLLLACSSSAGGGAPLDGGLILPGTGPAPDAGGPAPAIECGELARSQTLSQPCCPTYGADACGASLFCAAFDGRAQPTCYPERTRLDGASCTADIQCVSGECDPSTQKCRAMPGMACTGEVGCAKANGDRYGCNTSSASPKCQKIGDGSFDSFCAELGDCKSGACVANKCKAGAGEACHQNSDCIPSSMTCVYCAGQQGQCPGRPSGQQCLYACDDGAYRVMCPQPGGTPGGGTTLATAPSISCTTYIHPFFKTPTVHITWTPGSGGGAPHYFMVDRDSGSGFTNQGAVPATDPAIYEDTNLVTGKTYVYRMYATNYAGRSPTSNTCTITP